MKKIFAGVVLPTLAAVAVIGSGFSVWFFGENQDKVSTDASIEVENMVRIGNLTTSSENAVLHLDQTEEVRNYILGSADYVNSATNKNLDKKSNYEESAFGKNAAVKGIYLTSETEGFDGKIKYESSLHEKLDTVCNFKIVTTFTFEGAIKDYVGMVTTDISKGTWEDKGNGVYEFTWKNDYSVLEMKLPVGTYKDENATFGFKYLPYDNTKHYLGSLVDPNRTKYTDPASVMATAEPHSSQEYLNFRGKIQTPTKDSKLTISTVATLVDATTGA